MGLFGFGKKKGDAPRTDPVCGMQVDPGTTPFFAHHENRPFYFCSANCLGTFKADPAKYATKV
jgi:Cu+-exporting ATPase